MKNCNYCNDLGCQGCEPVRPSKTFLVLIFCGILALMLATIAIEIFI